MHNSYWDIRANIDRPPFWWDENGVPRYIQFHPNEAADIYADEVALIHIECQGCRTRFNVAMSSSPIVRVFSTKRKLSIAEEIKNQSLHYGDPPNINCCGAGPTMNCLDIQVLQYWRRGSRETLFEWVQVRELELPLGDADE